MWPLSTTICDYLMTMDVMLCTASIFNLCAISVDRSAPGKKKEAHIEIKFNKSQMELRQSETDRKNLPNSVMISLTS